MDLKQRGKNPRGGQMPHRQNGIVLEHIEAETVMPDVREPGFYWVRRLGESRLQIGHWTGTDWLLPGSKVHHSDDSFAAMSSHKVNVSVPRVA
jgi:hypothetical protein